MSILKMALSNDCLYQVYHPPLKVMEIDVSSLR